jgi:hypothetical protein
MSARLEADDRDLGGEEKLERLAGGTTTAEDKVARFRHHGFDR